MPTAVASTQPPASPEDPLCPNCFYNLRGLPEPRCPECGRPFDLDELRRLRGDCEAPASPWDTHKSWNGFVATWWLVMHSPARFAAEFPGKHNGDRALGYAFVCCALGVSIVALGLMVPPGPPSRSETLPGLIAAALLGMLTCHSASAAFLTRVIRPAYARRPFHFWLGLMHYTSGHFIITAALVGLSLVMSRLFVYFGAGRAAQQGVVLASFIGLAGNFIAWTATVSLMVIHRSQPGPRRLLGGLAAPVGALAGVATAALTSLVCALG